MSGSHPECTLTCICDWWNLYIYMALVCTALVPHLVSEHLNCALRSAGKYELCTAKRVHSAHSVDAQAVLFVKIAF